MRARVRREQRRSGEVYGHSNRAPVEVHAALRCYVWPSRTEEREDESRRATVTAWRLVAAPDADLRSGDLVTLVSDTQTGQIPTDRELEIEGEVLRRRTHADATLRDYQRR